MYIIKFTPMIQGSDEESSKSKIIQKIGEQSIIQYLIETLAKRMVTNGNILQEVTMMLH